MTIFWNFFINKKNVSIKFSKNTKILRKNKTKDSKDNYSINIKIECHFPNTKESKDN